MRHINDLTEPPVVGRTYLVPCVELGDQWWPIHGPRHADPDLGVPTDHYHYDGRFMTAEQVTINLVGLRRTEKALERRLEVFAQGYVEPVNEAIQIVHIVGEAEQIEDRPRRCVRQAVTFPRAEPDLEAKYESVKSDCRTCPHRGMRIDQQPADDRGGVVCPGHGLRWHRPSGALMRRGAKAPLTGWELLREPNDVDLSRLVFCKGYITVRRSLAGIVVVAQRWEGGPGFNPEDVNFSDNSPMFSDLAVPIEPGVWTWRGAMMKRGNTQWEGAWDGGFGPRGAGFIPTVAEVAESWGLDAAAQRRALELMKEDT